MLESERYQNLSMGARALIIEIQLKFNGCNNGKIGLGCREAARRLGVTKNTAHKYFEELKQAGFIAEEIAELFPEAVGFDEQGRPDSLNYNSLLALLWNRVNELERRLH